MLQTIAQNAKSVTADGKYIHQYEGGELQRPAGVTMDQNGYCLVRDWDGKPRCIFNHKDIFIHSVPAALWCYS